ncbi:hypothetical protein EDB81DRAFT_769609 [Dactylonectria macrodidyma]|uniref:Uncharacterized protein n=1 Tax=Dactylonectria macrodidyma TaxID=307937 RepID=A0A9P9FTX7_9HYPO|nr:hypothetical protein EDB81DRAFT_769609 [Dactylonectria macrodidyma]
MSPQLLASTVVMMLLHAHVFYLTLSNIISSSFLHIHSSKLIFFRLVASITKPDYPHRYLSVTFLVNPRTLHKGTCLLPGLRV